MVLMNCPLSQLWTPTSSREAGWLELSVPKLETFYSADKVFLVIPS
jgi:hypothetical protein